jgi:hypothetical protein
MSNFADSAGNGVRIGAAYSYFPSFSRGTTAFESNLKFVGEQTTLFGADTSTNTTKFLCYIAASGEIKTVIQAAEENSGNTTYTRSSGIFVPNDGAFHDVKVSYNFGFNTPYTVTIDGVASSGLNLAQNVYDVTWSKITAFILFAEKYREYAIDPNDANNTTLFKSVKFRADAWDLTNTVDNVAPSTVGGDALTLTDLSTVYHAGFLEYLGSLKFPAITGAIAGGVWRIRYEDIPAAALAQLNADGSDLRITTDVLGGTALPIDMVSFNKVVDGIDIRLKADGAADSMLYLWGNSPTAVQPLATDALGSQAVWADEISSLILMDGTSALTDRAGNVNDWRYAGSGGLSYSVNGTTLGADRMVASSSLYQTLLSDTTYHYRFIANVTAIAKDSTLIKAGSSEVRQNGTGNDFRIQFTNGARTAGSGFLTSFPAPTGMTVYDLVFDGSAHRLYKDGVQVWSYTYGVAMDWDATAFLFNHMTLVLQGLSISNGTIPVDRIVAEASNLSAVGAWFIGEDAPSSGATLSEPYSLQQSQSIGQVGVLQHSSITINSISQGSEVSQLATGSMTEADLASITNTQTIESITLTQSFVVIPDNLVMPQSVTNIAIASTNNIPINNLSSLESIGVAGIAQHNNVVTATITMQQVLSQLTTSKEDQVAIADLSTIQTVPQIIVNEFGNSTITISDLGNVTNLSEAMAIQHNGVIINNLATNQILEAISTSKVDLVAIDSLTQGELLSAITFGATVVGYLNGAPTIFYPYNGKIRVLEVLTGKMRIL